MGSCGAGAPARSAPCRAGRRGRSRGWRSRGEGAWIVVGAGGFVARSPDGQAFAPADAGGVDADLDAVCVLPGGALVAVGDRGVILRSADDGRSWRALPRSLGEGRLRALGRFGEGALIGGDGGLIGRLAPPDDATWSERADAFEVSPLDDAFSVGPEGFIENGLDVYLEAIANEGGAGAGEGEGDAAVGAGETGADAGGDAGEDVGAFREGYGMPLPPELAVFREMVPARRRRDAFEELRLDAALWPDVGERNLFELLVRRDQQAYLGDGSRRGVLRRVRDRLAGQRRHLSPRALRVGRRRGRCCTSITRRARSRACSPTRSTASCTSPRS